MRRDWAECLLVKVQERWFGRGVDAEDALLAAVGRALPSQLGWDLLLAALEPACEDEVTSAPRPEPPTVRIEEEPCEPEASAPERAPLARPAEEQDEEYSEEPSEVAREILQPAARKAGVAYVRAHRARRLDCIRAIHRDLGL